VTMIKEVEWPVVVVFLVNDLFVFEGNPGSSFKMIRLAICLGPEYPIRVYIIITTNQVPHL
jgi:hypothetical protein